jgi:hypothetical protein
VDIACIQVLPLPDHLLNLASVLLVLDPLNIQLTLDSEKILGLCFIRLLQFGEFFLKRFSLFFVNVTKLTDFFILGVEGKDYLFILIAQLCNGHFLLLETFLDNADFLRISEGILAPNDLFKLCP